MVKAHSLLYAIYICLIVSIICGALLYFANLYGQLNVHYNLQEELYLHNQSVVNFALGNNVAEEELPTEEKSGITGHYKVKQYGLLTLLLANSSVKNDTVTSAHFVGNFVRDNVAIHLANFTRSLAYSGQVKIIGNVLLPSTYIETSHINNERNELILQGEKAVSTISLPEIDPNFKKTVASIKAQNVALSDIEKVNDSLYHNSFFNETKEISISHIGNIIVKGNFVLRSNDSIRVSKNAVLEDVILIAPKISFEEGFKGTVQAFATKGITLEEKVTLNYPSVVCVYNETQEEAKILIKKESKITGAVVLFGNPMESIEKNTIEMEEDGLLLGDIYCSGKLCVKSTVYGSIYTNRLFHKTTSSSYDNTIANVEINTTKRPKYFIAIPLFDNKKTRYGILKKVL